LNVTDCRLLVFDTQLRENFYPLTFTKPGANLLFGAGTLLEGIERNLSTKATDIYVPAYMRDYVKEITSGLSVNQVVSSPTIIVNSFVSHRPEIWNFISNALKQEPKDDFVYHDQFGNTVFGRLNEFDPSASERLERKEKSASPSIRKIWKKELPPDVGDRSLLRYPWELVGENAKQIEQDYLKKDHSSLKSPTSRSGDIEVRGNRTAIAPSADIERFVALDSRSGPIVIDEEAEVQSFSRITGPCYVGKKAKIRSARIREGTTIGSNSKVSGEIEQSIISEFSNKSHEGFLGHSIVGSWVNLGALTTCSDLKNTYGKIKVNLGRKVLDTGEVKLGVFLGDMCKTAIGVLLTSGKKVGVASQVFGSVSQDVPSFTLYGKSLGAKSSEVMLDSAILTQKRMMERRGLSLNDSLASLIRSVYKMTKRERAFQRVSKARFKLS